MNECIECGTDDVTKVCSWCGDDMCNDCYFRLEGRCWSCETEEEDNE